MSKKRITIERTEQWEYTASGFGMEVVGPSAVEAELKLLRKKLKIGKPEISCCCRVAYVKEEI